MFFKDNKIKAALIDYLDYVQREHLDNFSNEEVIKKFESFYKYAYEFIYANEWALAFEIVSENLVEYFIFLNREGIEKVKNIVELRIVEEDWTYDLRAIRSKGYINGSWRLMDAEVSAKEFPYTFYKPSRSITDQLKIGNLVKLIFTFESKNEEHPGGERMWVEITEILPTAFKGNLNNMPLFLHELFLDDEIIFEHKHIIDHNLGLSEPNLVDKYINRCFVTAKVLYQNQKINYLFREEPLEKDANEEFEDSGWRIMAGDESEDYMDDTQNIYYVSLGAVLSRDDSIVDLLDAPVGSYFERSENGQFVKVEDI